MKQIKFLKRLLKINVEYSFIDNRQEVFYLDKVKLGRTNLMVSRTSFGALPIQRIDFEEAKKILRKAYDNGINFFDTARGYSNSEEKIGYALSDVRKDIVIATKTHAKDKKSLFKDLETSLRNLKRDYVDILQLHNPEYLPSPGTDDDLYEALLEAKEKGLTRYIGITNHRLNIAMKAVASNLYDTIQFPLSSISSAEDLALIKACEKNNIGIIAMKALCGGIITNATSAFAFLRQYENLVPIWGIQRESELDEFIALEKELPTLDEAMIKIIEKDRNDLAGTFCRACGYCMPCSVGIEITMAGRMSLLLRRSPYQRFLEDQWKEKMELINQCTDCGKCKEKCPYGIDTPNLLRSMLKDYEEFYSVHKVQ